MNVQLLFEAAVALTIILCRLDASASYDGCLVRFGRRGCRHRVVSGVSVACNGYGTESSIPHNLPPDTVHLTFVNYNLTRLTRSDMDPFASVQCLTISDSRLLTDIDWDTFAGMQSLVELTLDAVDIDDRQATFISHPSAANLEMLSITRSTRLTSFTANGATRTLHELRTLDLRHNLIEDISASVYPELRRLERLDLTGNRLATLNWTQIANHVTHLNALLLAGNRFQTLPVAAHAVFFAVKELTLADNQLHCNCDLLWLREFYQRFHAVDKILDNVRCSSPHSEWLSVNPDSQHLSRSTSINEQFTCIEPQLPVITWTKVTADHRVEVNCTSYGDPSPRLTVTLGNGRTLISPPSTRLSEQLTSTPQLLVNSGYVTCLASNTVGSISNTLWVGPLETGSKASTTDRCHLHTVAAWMIVIILTKHVQ